MMREVLASETLPLKLASTIAPHHIGDGHSTLFWQHPWHPLGILADLFPQHLRTKLSCCDSEIEDTDQNRNCVQDWNLSNKFKLKKPIKCSWKKPLAGFHAINTDGSFAEDGGYGALVRTEDGTTIKAVPGKVKSHSVIYHELQGIEAGLLLGIRLAICKVILYSDSGKAVHLLQRNGKHSWQVGRIVARIKTLMASFESCIIENVLREINAAADHLSKIKPTEGFIELSPSEFSNELRIIIEEDASGKSTFDFDGVSVPCIYQRYCYSIVQPPLDAYTALSILTSILMILYSIFKKDKRLGSSKQLMRNVFKGVGLHDRLSACPLLFFNPFLLREWANLTYSLPSIY
ncbi:hypothetical protein GIB67_023306 [Kingdonia uniflora]|uniref:RNase H type-1 domain-containing protein n=1 Tax=Kingdonia uniflora TaxID=39325 RepID=A0A7J7KX81_9MAGN|nr:hypothetical protein GIB67_023306 [Kingdonia uniflora]